VGGGGGSYVCGSPALSCDRLPGSDRNCGLSGPTITLNLFFLILIRTTSYSYVREKNLRAFAESHQLPVIAENCPACFEAPKVCARTAAPCYGVKDIERPAIITSLSFTLGPFMYAPKCTHTHTLVPAHRTHMGVLPCCAGAAPCQAVACCPGAAVPAPIRQSAARHDTAHEQEQDRSGEAALDGACR